MLQWPSGVSVCGIYYDCKCLQTLLCRQIMISQIMGKTWKLEPLTSTLREHNDILLELLCPLYPLRGTLTTNQCKVVLSDHLYAGMKPFYPEGSGLFPSQAARGLLMMKIMSRMAFDTLTRVPETGTTNAKAGSTWWPSALHFLYFVPSHQPLPLLSCSLSTVLSPFPSVSFPPSFSMSHPFSSLATSLLYSFHFLPHSLPPPQ